MLRKLCATHCLLCSAKDLHSAYKLLGYLFIYSVYSFIHSFNILIEHSRVHAGD